MKVLVFNRSYWPDAAATGQLLTQLCEDLVARHGMSVTVVCGDAHGSRRGEPGLVRSEIRHGVRILRARGTAFDKGFLPGRVANYLTYVASAWLAARRAESPDVVVSLTDPPVIGLVALGAARRAGARFVYVCQDLFPEVTRLLDGFRSRLVDWTLERIGRRLVARADRVVAIGERMRDRLIESKGADPGRLAVIHNWADCAAIIPRPKDTPFARAHGFVEPFVVMHSGNVGLSQNLDAFVEAAARLREHCAILWVIMGDGARRGALRARARELGLSQLQFLPPQPAERLADAFGAADVFVIGLREGLAGAIVPSKLYGILAAGRPCIAAVEPAAEAAEITTKYDCGLLAPPGDADALAARVLELYRDRQLARHLGTNARRAAQSFDRPGQVDLYARLLRETAAAPAARARGERLKRAFDVALAGLGLLVSAPLWGAIALAIKADDGGPVFFGQERVGLSGRRFTGWKFRSMVVGAERAGPVQAAEDDRRVTRVGRFLRRTAMDELPQLWNIFVGDMSFVGPRALVPAEIETGSPGTLGRLEDVPGYGARHRVRPGLTGIAQVFAPRDVTRRRKFRYDLLYIRRRSFLLDLKLILLSFWITFRARWEHRGPKV